MGEKTENKAIHPVFGIIPSGWEIKTLEEISVGKNGIQTGPFGSQLHKSDYQPVGTPIITVEHLGENRILHENLPLVSDQDRIRLKKYWMQKGDIIFSRVGSVDRRSLVRDEEDGWLFSGRCLRVRPDTTKADPEYLSWFMGRPNFQEYIRQIAYGAVMPSLNTELLSDVEVVIPPLSEQKRIAYILGTLDDKIELNRRTNQTLESIARAIFKSWFVDFDPVRAKMDGRPTGLPDEVSALFPDSFEDSELGKIPSGWRVVPVSEFIEVNPTRTLKKKSLAPYLPMSGCAERGHRPAEYYPRVFGSGTKFMNGDTLLARITPSLENGKTTFVDFLENGEVGWGSTEFIILRSKNGYAPQFSYFLARDPEFRENAIINMTGSSGRQRVPPDAIEQYLFPLPPVQVVEEFGKVAEKVSRKIKANDEESQTLTEIRDTLLPRLMRGELIV